MTRRIVLGILAGLLLLVAAVLPATSEAAAKRRPDLRVTQLDVPATSPSAAALVVRAKVSNAGRKARKSVLRLYLSPDAKAGRGDAVLGKAAIPALKPGRAARRRMMVTLPAVTGARRLIACADATRKVRERKERNNCRARSVTLEAPEQEGPPTPTVTGPFDVVAKADAARSVTSIVPPSGATLTATGADGTVYTLAVPQDAVLGDTEMTMTPLASADGHPLDGAFSGGVQLGPDGLQLRVPATLTVTPPAPLPAEQVTTLGYEGTGNDLHLFPGIVDGGAIKLYVSHFSGVVVGLASLTRQEELAKARVESEQSRYERDVAAAINEAKRTGKQLDDPTIQAALIAALKAQYNNLIGPELDAAQTDDSRYYSSLRALISWDRTIGILNLSSCSFLSSGCDVADPFNAERAHADRRWRKVVRNAYTLARRRCVEEFDPRYAVRILAIAKDAALLNLDIGDLGDVAACLKFELHVDTTVTREEKSGGETVGSATAHVEMPAMRIRVQPGSPFTGAGAWQALGYSRTPDPTNGCTYEWVGTAGTGTPAELAQLSLPLDQPTADVPNLYDLTVHFRIFGTLGITERETCPDENGNPQSHESTQHVLQHWIEPTLDLGPNNERWYQHFTYVGNGTVFARKILNRTKRFQSQDCCETLFHEQTTVTLKHTPGAP